MQSGTCPKCGAADIYHRQARRNRPGGPPSVRPVYTYVCRACGYLETYISRENVATLIHAPGWTRVPPAQTPTSAAVTGETIRLDDQSLALATTPSDEPLDLALDHTCPVCQSDLLIPYVRVMLIGEGDLLAEVERFPDALLFKDEIRSPIRARICGNCGYVVFFVESPSALYNAHLDANR
jgi:hypothetical protein